MQASQFLENLTDSWFYILLVFITRESSGQQQIWLSKPQNPYGDSTSNCPAACLIIIV